MSRSIPAVLALIAARRTAPITLVAIDGHSAAGKSSLAAAIQQAHPNVAVVHTDDFYRVLAAHERALLDAEAGYQHYYDWQRLAASVLAPLSKGMSARYQHYDWATNQLADWVDVPPSGVVVVEGCYAARPELRHYYHAIVLVATAAAQRHQRQAVRADAHVWVERWDAAECYYMDTYKPETYADLVVAGE